MFSYLIRRLWQMIPTILGVLLLVFFLFNWVGGDPAYVLAGKISNPEQIANIRHQLGIDEPVYVQLWIFLKQTICFDFGNSWSTGESVSSILLSRLGPSLTLLIPLTFLETGLAIALGLAVAYVRMIVNRQDDHDRLYSRHVGQYFGLHHRFPVSARL